MRDYPIYFENLRITGFSCFHEVFCMLNKSFTAFVLVYLNNYTIFQGMSLLQFAVFKLCLTIHLNPFRSRLTFYLELLNEFAVLIVMYCLYLKMNKAFDV